MYLVSIQHSRLWAFSYSAFCSYSSHLLIFFLSQFLNSKNDQFSKGILHPFRALHSFLSSSVLSANCDLSSVICLSYQQFLLSISESLASIMLRSALDPLGLSSQAKSLHPNAWLFLTLPPGDTFLSLPSSLRLGAPSH